ncbi:hypothetical protein BESB_018050 [Besnoitia besnoiti]|uniref:Uncharacterized protein n=1 Tax=Besnoitia besnoiti TaxID=94643 RepID=A0A2A9MA52_BESBE|nr:hypothetical protein BESB_018050 [Besnoitia besnoiti]PFH32487.1 hypothetical protein BESB_018050 [Besnoitia besnoiti]
MVSQCPSISAATYAPAAPQRYSAPGAAAGDALFAPTKSNEKPVEWQRMFDWLVGPDTEQPNTETVGGCGFEFMGWAINFFRHRREIRAPPPQLQAPSVVFPYSESLYVPSKRSGLIPCLDDPGTGSLASPPLVAVQRVVPMQSTYCPGCAQCPLRERHFQQAAAPGAYYWLPAAEGSRHAYYTASAPGLETQTTCAAAPWGAGYGMREETGASSLPEPAREPSQTLERAPSSGSTASGEGEEIIFPFAREGTFPYVR